MKPRAHAGVLVDDDRPQEKNLTPLRIFCLLLRLGKHQQELGGEGGGKVNGPWLQLGVNNQEGIHFFGAGGGGRGGFSPLPEHSRDSFAEGKGGVRQARKTECSEPNVPDGTDSFAPDPVQGSGWVRVCPGPRSSGHEPPRP